MDSLFGDASTVMGTPSIHGAETGSLMRPGSPSIGPSSAIPGMSLNSPDIDDDRKSQAQSGGGEDRGWFSRVVNRGRSGSGGSGQGRYTPLGQQE